MMKKIFKGIVIVALIGVMIVNSFLNPSTASAASASKANNLKELRAELAAYQAKMNAAKQGSQNAQNKINSNKNSITAAEAEINTNKQKIEDSKKKIEELNVEIRDTEEQIKELLRSYEIMKGDNVYLDYIFGATSVSDFIIRCSISGQLASYNDELVASYEAKISENEQLQIDLNNREKQLDSQIENLENSITSLGEQIRQFDSEAVKFEDEVIATQESINYYVKQGCKETESFDSCVSMRSDTGFVRPLKKGVRTSNFGYRGTNPATGAPNDYHSGVDIGGNGEGTNVYSVANGRVGKIVRRSSCGGNVVYVYHTINGTKYTSAYMHLLSIKVNVGDLVTNTTVVGTVGGGAGTRSYDKCSTGPHLHLSLGTGWYGSTYVSYSSWRSHLVDPGKKDYVNIPAKGKWFYSRTWN